MHFINSRSIWIGYDPREVAAFAVARTSCYANLKDDIPIHGLVLNKLIDAGLYRRPIEYRKSAVDRPIMWDTLSDAPMSTQHANARFLVPTLAKAKGFYGWALFSDGDFLYRSDVAPLFSSFDPSCAVYCVKHPDYDALESTIKMDGQTQTAYKRKNWSSFMAWNLDHPANDALTVDLVNTVPGRDLHRFCWLNDEALIGAIPPEWNFLVGVSDVKVKPKAVHFTQGVPDMPGYENVPYADEWRKVLDKWAD